MSHDLAIGELSEQEIRCIKEMRQRKARDCVVRVPFTQCSIPAGADIERLVQRYDLAVNNLRPGQHDFDRNLLNLQDPIAMIPSGGGKTFVWLLLAIIGVQNITLIITYLLAQHNKY